MAAPVLAPMPDNLNLGSGYTLRVAALDPSTGNPVAGVNIGLEVITGTAIDDGETLTVNNPILLGLSS